RIPPKRATSARTYLFVHDGDGFGIVDGAQGGLNRRRRAERDARGLANSNGARGHLERDVSSRDGGGEASYFRSREILVGAFTFETDAGERPVAYAIQIEADLAQSGDRRQGRAPQAGDREDQREEDDAQGESSHSGSHAGGSRGSNHLGHG